MCGLFIQIGIEAGRSEDLKCLSLVLGGGGFYGRMD